MVDKLNIYQKLIEVRKVLGKVNKDTKGYGFEYVSGAQILGKIEDKMNDWIVNDGDINGEDWVVV